MLVYLSRSSSSDPSSGNASTTSLCTPAVTNSSPWFQQQEALDFPDLFCTFLSPSSGSSSMSEIALCLQPLALVLVAQHGSSLLGICWMNELSLRWLPCSGLWLQAAAALISFQVVQSGLKKEPALVSLVVRFHLPQWGSILHHIPPGPEVGLTLEHKLWDTYPPSFSPHHFPLQKSAKSLVSLRAAIDTPCCLLALLTPCCHLSGEREKEQVWLEIGRSEGRAGESYLDVLGLLSSQWKGKCWFSISSFFIFGPLFRDGMNDLVSETPGSPLREGPQSYLSQPAAF